MISTDRFLTLIVALGLSWQESCGDPLLFCYRVTCGFVAPWRERRLHRDNHRNNKEASCSIPSGT